MIVLKIKEEREKKVGEKKEKIGKIVEDEDLEKMEIVNEKKKIGREKGREKVRNDEGGEVMDKIVK